MTEENRTGISFSMKRGRVLIYRCTLRSLGVPKNIRFLLNVKKKRITGEVYPENRLVEFAFGDAVMIADEEFVDPEVEKG